MLKYSLEEFDFILPSSMRAVLALGEHERFAGVEAAIYRWE
jgi:hypothetical protein